MEKPLTMNFMVFYFATCVMLVISTFQDSSLVSHKNGYKWSPYFYAENIRFICVLYHVVHH